MAKNKYLLTGQGRAALEAFKMECATEIGVTNYNSIDKGDLPSRTNGSVGGQMVKKMIFWAEENMINSSQVPTYQTHSTQRSITH